MQSVHINTSVVSSHPDHGEVYSIHHYVIKLFSDLRQCRWLSSGTPVSKTNKPDLHHTTEILSKVALKTITLTLKGAENIGAYVKYFRTLFIIKKIIK
jgi:hypothetical protein